LLVLVSQVDAQKRETATARNFTLKQSSKLNFFNVLT